MFDEIVLVFLYLYPGSLVDVFSASLFPYSFRKDESSNFEKAARYFSYSIIISTISLLIYASIFEDGVYNFPKIVESLTGVFSLFEFVLISLSVTFAFSILLKILKKLLEFVKNLSVLKSAKQFILGRKSVKSFIKLIQKLQVNDVEIEVVDGWMQIVRGHDFDELGDNLIVSITNGEHTIAGYKYGWGDSFEDGISLWRCDTVTEQIKAEEKMPSGDEGILIGASWGCYYDPKSNTLVRFYDGRDFK